MPKKKKRIRVGKVSYLSLCPKGANRFEMVFKDKDSNGFEMETLVKEGSNFDEEGVIYGIVYAPNVEDTQGDFADAATIKEMMYDFGKNGKGIDILHSFEAVNKSEAYIVENFLIQKGDERFQGIKDKDGTKIDATGGWAVAIKLESEELKEKYRSGEWSGISIGGMALREEVEEDVTPGLVQRVLSLIKKSLATEEKQKREQDENMDPTELAKAIAAGLAPQFDSLQKSIEDLKPVEKSEDEDPAKKEGTPEDEVKLMDQASVKARIKKLQEEEVKKSVDVDDIESLQAHLELLEKTQSKKKEKKESFQSIEKADTLESAVDSLAELASPDYRKGK